MPDSFLRLLKILDVDVTKLRIATKPIQYRTIILPDESYIESDGSRFYTQEYIDTIEQVRAFAQKHYQPLSQKKIYYFHGRDQIGEERVAEYFKSKGYEIVRPEKLPLEEQLNILANCESFASSLGSISHNVIFMKDNTEAVFIPRAAARASNTYQRSINQLRNLNATYIDSTFSVYSSLYHGPYCYILSKQLRQYFGDEIVADYTDEDFVTFLLYLRYCMLNKRTLFADAMKYYGNTYIEFLSRLEQRQDLIQKYGVRLK